MCMLLGVTGTVCFLFIHFGRRIVLRVLTDDSNVAVRLPSPEDIRVYQQALLKNILHCKTCSQSLMVSS